MISMISLATVATVLSTVSCAVPPTIFAPAPMPDIDRHDLAQIKPSSTVSLNYASNLTSHQASSINVTHSLNYPAVNLEDVASVVSVDCSTDSVVVTFNDSSVFEATQTAWNAEGTFVLVTNHLGDCDVELERAMFVVNSLSFDDAALVATASSARANVSSIASLTEVTFGGLPGSALASRSLIIDPSYSLDLDYALPSATTLYSYAPYLTVSANAAAFVANVTFSGYLKYNWLTVSLTDLYFDIDSLLSASLTLEADITAAYNKSFTYAPSTLTYSVVSVPGVIELGPELSFSVGVDIAASAAADLTASASVEIADGNIHLDALHTNLTSTSGWTPEYSVDATVSGSVVASINPAIGLTVEIALKFFSGLVDLSSGLTVTPSFTNVFTLTGAEGVDLTGLKNLTSSGTCANGLELKSDFTFDIFAFATQWWSKTIYKVDVPIVDKCYSWE